jgi:hypothetical protein
MKIKPGDKVKVTNNLVHAGLRDKEGNRRPLQAGDVIEVKEVLDTIKGHGNPFDPDAPFVLYEVIGEEVRAIGRIYQDRNWLPASHIELLETSNCTCDRRTLMMTGCQCGYLQKERAGT